jgi:hypothetical protein
MAATQQVGGRLGNAAGVQHIIADGFTESTGRLIGAMARTLLSDVHLIDVLAHPPSPIFSIDRLERNTVWGAE